MERGEKIKFSHNYCAIYILDAKISLQHEECVLNYLRNCIISSSHNPIKKAGVIAISENRN